MNGARIDGALQFPAFLLMWSAGFLVLVGGFYRADAALVSSSPVAFTILQAVPSLTEPQAFGSDLDSALRASDVMAGAWQPSIATPVVVSEPITVAPVTPPSTPAVWKAPVQDPQSGPASMTKRPVVNSVPRTDSRIVDLRIEARTALAQRNSVKAYRLLMRNLPIASEDIDYLALLAVAALDLQRSDEALLIYEKLIKLARTDSRWWMGLAVCQENLGIDASALYEEVVRLTEEGSPLQVLALDKLDIGGNLS